MARHKHADVIHAMAEGAEIEYLHKCQWFSCINPAFYENMSYRIKPEVKPDTVSYSYVTTYGYTLEEVTKARGNFTHRPIIKLTIDGETNEIKSVELIKC